ncbi:MAG: aminoglycoside phosphotransferase family protein [Gaiellaceae bacterium]
MRIPSGLRWWRTVTGGTAWLERLPDLVEECATLWGLELEASFEQVHVSFVARARLPDGTAAVLKVNFPEPEGEHEPDALAHWGGEGAVRLLAHDPERRALLVERCEPGTTLWELADEEEANRLAAGLLRRLWRPPPAEHPFRHLADEAARWAEELPIRWRGLGEPFERELLEEAVAFLREAGPAQGEEAVLHQDFHGGNVLRARREHWLAIDPKPLVGEREFDTASLLRDRRAELVRDPDPQARVRRRLDQLAGELELDPERMRGWGIAHALAWDADEQMIACARWLAAAR